MKFIKTTIIGGVLFLIPVVVVALVIQKAFDAMLVIAKPMADVIPMDSVAGVALANIIAAIIVIVACFVSGLLSRTQAAKKLVDILDSKLRKAIPGYAMIRGITSNLSAEQEGAMRSVLVQYEDRARLGMAPEGVVGGKVAVYFPGSPNVWAGTVEIIDDARVEYLGTSIKSLLEAVEGFGAGSVELIQGN